MAILTVNPAREFIPHLPGVITRIFAAVSGDRSVER
jgi:hypothetical protein